MKSHCRKFFYLAPPFSGFASHYFNYAYGLFQACRKAGIAFQALGSSRAGINEKFPGDLPFHGHYPQLTPFRIAKIRMGWIEKTGLFFLTCKSHLALGRMPGFDRSALCLIEEPRAFDVTAFQLWLRTLKRDNCPELCFLFRYGLKSPAGEWLPMRDEHDPVLRVLEKEGKRLPVSILTDSHLVAEHLKELTALPVRVIPTHFRIPEARGSLRLREKKEPVHFYLPGIYSLTKGVPLLIQALQRLKGDPVMESMRFTIPFYPEPKQGSAMMQTQVLLESLNLSQVEILRKELEQEEYYRRFFGADVILSPYDPDRYQSTSGPFAEALAFGKPVLTSEKTWMSAMLERGYGAGLTFPFGDSAGLAEALGRMVGDFKELSGKAQANKEKWIETNGPQAILRELLKVI